MLDPSLFLVPLLPCELPSSKALPKTQEQGSNLMKQTLKHAWRLWFQDGEVEAEEDYSGDDYDDMYGIGKIW